MVSRSAAEQNEDCSAAGRLSGDDTGLHVSNQDRIGQADRVFLSGLVQQFRFWLAAAAMIVIIAGTDQNNFDVRSFPARGAGRVSARESGAACHSKSTLLPSTVDSS